MRQRRGMTRQVAIGGWLAGWLLLGGCAQAPAPVALATKDPQVILQEMAQPLAGAAGFRVTIQSEYDALQADGERISFGDRREVALQRPGQLRIERTRSDGTESLLLYDGEVLTVYKPGERVHATARKPGTVDEIVQFMVRDLQMEVPLARLLLTSLPQEIGSTLTDLAYVEENGLLGETTDHIAARTADVDVQFWVTRTQPRLLRRVVLTYVQQPGQPQFRADLTGWQLAPAFKDEAFRFSPPAGSESIPLLLPLRKPTVPATGQGARR